jgi:large subunit ribosomal protein L15
MSKLHNLKPHSSQQKNRKRVGRGNGSNGTFSGKGMNGQNARSGGGVRPGFEGGQTPLHKRMPKIKGFNNINHVEYKPLSLSTLSEHFSDGDTVTKQELVAKNLFHKNDKIKLLANGELDKKLTIEVDKASKKAQELVEKSGGTVKVSSN